MYTVPPLPHQASRQLHALKSTTAKLSDCYCVESGGSDLSNSLKYTLGGSAIAVVGLWGGAGGEYNFFDLVLGVVIFGAIGFGVAKFKDTN